jgi:hypothetical protein
MLAGLVACALTVAVEPAHLNLQTPPHEARVVVTGARSPRLWASIGELSAIRALGNGRYEARYRPPASGSPSWAVIAAWDPRSGAASVSVIELWARTELPVDTEPGAHVVVTAGGHRATARADGNGQARVVLWLGPTATRARVTAEDAAGNTTVEEIALDVPKPTRLWLVPGSPPGVTPVRVYAFAASRALPHVTASGGEVDVDAEPGVASCVVRAAPDAREVALTAQVENERATLVLAAAAATAGGAIGDGGDSGSLRASARFTDARWEVGGSVGPRISDAFTGAGVTVEWRRQLRETRWHLGVDVGGLYATGAAGNQSDVRFGGVVARVGVEARLSLSPRVALSLWAFAGGALGGERRIPVVGAATTAFDGAPSLGGAAALLVRVGPGLLTFSLGGAWTPLLGLDRANLDGGMLAVGYRYGRFQNTDAGAPVAANR